VLQLEEKTTTINWTVRKGEELRRAASKKQRDRKRREEIELRKAKGGIKEGS